MTAAQPVDPRIALAVSVLDHATGQTPERQAQAIDRALLALRGATLEEIRRVTE